jgi:hypothetical protein
MTPRISQIDPRITGFNSLCNIQILLLLGVCGFLTHLLTVHADVAKPSPLTNVQAVLRLPMNLVRLRVPVQIQHAVVTLSVPENRLFFYSRRHCRHSRGARQSVPPYAGGRSSGSQRNCWNWTIAPGNYGSSSRSVGQRKIPPRNSQASMPERRWRSRDLLRPGVFHP